MSLRARVVVLLAASAAWPASAAHASDYCVAPNTSCGGTNVASFEDALTAAATATDADRIFLGAATYLAPASTGFSYNAPLAPVEIAGAGSGQTILTGQIGGSSAVLDLRPGPGSSVHDLTIRLPQNAAAGLAGLRGFGVAARRIEVLEAETQANARNGVELYEGSLEGSTVRIGGVQNTAGVFLGSGGEAVRDSTVQGRAAVIAAYGGSVERSLLYGSANGILADRFTTLITDSLISVTGRYAIVVAARPGQDTTVNADGVTLIGPGTPGSTGVVAANNVATDRKATVNLADALLRGFGQSLATFGTAPGEARINAGYSDYDPAANASTGPGGIGATNVTNVGDARFVNPLGGDYRLRFDSPLIDIGEPTPPTTTTDLAGGARLVDGDAVPGARRDIGAFEYQARPPVAAISGPAAAVQGAQVSFSGTGSSDPDPGDPIASYAWTVDGAPAGSGPTQTAVFQTAGAHSVGLTVTDPTGRRSSATHTIAVSARDTAAPVISNLRARPARPRRGRAVRFRFDLDEAAAVRVEIQQARRGRREAGRCRAPSRRNRAGRRCTRYVRVTVLQAAGTAGANSVRFPGRIRGRALAAGRYRARVTATDGAGNRSAPARVPFKVVT